MPVCILYGNRCTVRTANAHHRHGCMQNNDIKYIQTSDVDNIPMQELAKVRPFFINSPFPQSKWDGSSLDRIFPWILLINKFKELYLINCILNGRLSSLIIIIMVKGISIVNRGLGWRGSQHCKACNCYQICKKGSYSLSLFPTSIIYNS